MKSTRKRTAKKRHPSVRDASPGKDPEGRNNSRKRKVDSDMLGSQWTEEELYRFYDAYRKYGRDYKKIATVVKNRDQTMVEALVTMNKAYLSLPEGTASVVGLVAMMQDYYSNLASDSEQESNDGVGTSRKPPKRAKGKSQPSNFKTNDRHLLSDSPTTTSGYGLQSLLKKKRSGGSRPRAVGKRTPRFPIGYSRENVKGEKLFSPTQANLKLKATSNDDDLHEIALALTEASQRGGSPQVSHTPGRRTESVMSSPARRTDKKVTKVKHVESDIDEEEELEGSMEADTGELSGYNTYLKQSARISNRVKGRRFDGKKFDVDDTGDNHVDDTREACSGTEGQRLGVVRHADARLSKPSSQGPRKKSKKALFKRDDEETALDALRILSNMSSMMHADANDGESTELIKDDHDNHVDEPKPLEENVPIAHRRLKRKYFGQRIKNDESVDATLEQISNKLPKSGKASHADPKAIPEVNEEVYPSKFSRKKPKVVPSKIRKSEDRPSGDFVQHQEAEPIDAGKFIKKKRSSQSASPKLTKDTDHSSSNDVKIDGSDTAQSTVQIPLVTQMNSQTRKRSKRKTYLKKPDASDLDFAEKLVNVVMPSASGTTSSLKSKLLNCLSRPLPRRWCTYEWFYNAIDYPWYAKQEFVEYLNHAGLGHVPRLARLEWSVIRSSLGKPRRFSQQFLKEEKEKLNKYRETVRTNYTELRNCLREGLPADLARPLSVGQRVVAIHPKTREIHDGNVLTVDHSRCRVQFDRADLGVEFVMDIDCMPLNPKDNLPVMLSRQLDIKDFENFSGFRMNEQAKEYMKILPSDNLENINGHPHVSPSTFHLTNPLKQTKMAPEDANLQARLASRETPTYQSVAYSQPSAAAQVQAKEADVQVLANLNRSLDKKEALVSELKQMNDDVVENSSLKESETFKKQYAAVLVQLHDANVQVASALTSLRQRNTYPGTISVAPKPVGDSAVILSSLDRSNCQSPESGSQVNEIIESSRKKAGTMVDIALQAMSSLKGQENMPGKMEEAIEFVNRQLPLDDSASISAANDPETKFGSDNNEGPVPSELIAQCVATLLMIQKCTERQFPPAEVAEILESAVTSLKPRCPQNLPVYTDIQKCMVMVKNQILALIPT